MASFRIASFRIASFKTASRWAGAALPALLLLTPVSGCGASRQIHKGDAALAEGHLSSANQAYRAALARTPGEPRALLGMARVALDDHDPEAAIVPARGAYEAGAKGAAVVYARALLEGGQGRDALAPAQAALKADPEDLEARALISEALLATGDLAGALEVAKGLEGASPRGRSLEGWLYARTGDMARASALVSQAAASGLDDVAVQTEAAAVLTLAGESASARAAARAAVALGASAGPLAKEAARRDQGGDREGAIRRLAWAYALDGDDGRITAKLGELLLAQGDAARAAGFLDRALTLAPYRDPKVSKVTVARADDWSEPVRKQQVAEVQRALAYARGQIGDTRGAAAALEQAALLNGADAASWLAIADAWERARDLPAAREALSRAVSADASNATARLRLARSLAAAGQVGPAIGHARAGWELDPRNPDAALLLGSLYEARGETQSAREVYRVALGYVPGNKGLSEALSRVGG